MLRFMPMESSALEAGAVPAPVATATGSGDDRFGALPKAPFDTIPTHGVVNSIKSGRTKYDGVYHLIFKNLCAGNVGFFNLRELTDIMDEFNKYARYVRKFNIMKVHNERKRIYDDVMSRPHVDVKRLIGEFLSLSDIQLTHIVPLSLDSLLKQKQLMYQNIAHILATKARNIVCNHKRFKHTFRYMPSDDERLKHYFIQHTMREIDYLELRPVTHSMYTHLRSLYEAKCEKARQRREEEEEYERDLLQQEEEDEERRYQRARRGFEYDDEDHYDGLTQNGYRRDWYSGRRRGAGSDSD